MGGGPSPDPKGWKEDDVKLNYEEVLVVITHEEVVVIIGHNPATRIPRS